MPGGAGDVANITTVTTTPTTTPARIEKPGLRRRDIRIIGMILAA